MSASSKTLSRRHALHALGIAGGAALLGRVPVVASEKGIGSARGSTPNGPRGTTLAPIRQIDAGLLNVGYAEVGPAQGRAVVLLHGWPYDIHSYDEVAPLLASRGYRVIAPYLRGYGTTRFLSGDTPRNGQPSALAVDLTAFLDALAIDKAILAGFDWGARTGDIVAALWPERCSALVSVSGYLIGSQAAGKLPLPPPGSSSGGTSSTSRRSAAGPGTTGTGATSRS
jgi:pimeloyl-ACP methyl ester carboxylesterase